MMTRCDGTEPDDAGKKVTFLYIAVSSPLDRSKRFTRVALPDKPVHSDTNSTSLGSNAAITPEDCPLTFPPPSLARYSFIQLSDWGVVKRTEMSNLQNGSKGDLTPGSLDCKSGILPRSVLYE